MKTHGWLMAMILLFGFGITNVFAQCSYGPIMVTCHQDPGYNHPICCGWWPVCERTPDGNPASLGTHGSDIKNPSSGLGPSCGGGNTATGPGDAFTGTCGWSESGSFCGTPWGPNSVTGDYTAYPCSGSCG